LTITLVAVIEVLSVKPIPPVTAYSIPTVKYIALTKGTTNPAPAVFPGHIMFITAEVVPSVTLVALKNLIYTGVARILKQVTDVTAPGVALTTAAAGVAGATAVVKELNIVCHWLPICALAASGSTRHNRTISLRIMLPSCNQAVLNPMNYLVSIGAAPALAVDGGG
jgi:hypothetical protein